LVIANLEGFWNIAFPKIADGKEWTKAKVNAFDPADGFNCGKNTVKGNDAVGKYQYCPDDDTINFDQNLMSQVYENIGDLAEGAIIGKLYSQRAEKLAGLPTDSIEAALRADCFTGVWVATTATDEINNILPPEAQLSLSPGDLDEAVSAFIQFGDKADDVESGKTSGGSAFQHLDAFRAGFFKGFNEGFNAGLTACVGGSGAEAASTDSTSTDSTASTDSASS
jgi:predicted metalloprotease